MSKALYTFFEIYWPLSERETERKSKITLLRQNCPIPFETLPQTAGRFQLNTELDIPFDGWGRMEVDLLCTEARLAV